MSSRILWDALCWLTPISLPSSPEERFTYSFMPPKSARAFSGSTWYGFTCGELQGRSGVTISLGQELEFGPHRARNREVGRSHQATEFRFEIHAELERHEERVRVEKDDSGRHFRSSMRVQVVSSRESRGRF